MKKKQSPIAIEEHTKAIIDELAQEHNTSRIRIVDAAIAAFKSLPTNARIEEFMKMYEPKEDTTP